MSRTNKTTPFWVRAQRDPSLAVTRHDHRNGVCDFSDQKDSDTYPAWFIDGRCGYVPSNWALYERGGGCGCALCTNKYERREDRRRSRHEVTALTRQLEKRYFSGVALVDA